MCSLVITLPCSQESFLRRSVQKVVQTSLISWQISWFWRRANRVPSISLTHRSLAKSKHDLLLHLVDILFKVCIVFLVLFLSALVDKHPAKNNYGGDGYSYSEVDPEFNRNDRIGI
jgi:hypothetical protein